MTKAGGAREGVTAVHCREDSLVALFGKTLISTT